MSLPIEEQLERYFDEVGRTQTAADTSWPLDTDAAETNRARSNLEVKIMGDAPTEPRSITRWLAAAAAVVAVVVGGLALVVGRNDPGDEDDAVEDPASTAEDSLDTIVPAASSELEDIAESVIVALDARDEQALRSLVRDARQVVYFGNVGVDAVVENLAWMDIVDLRLARQRECGELSPVSVWCEVEQWTALELIDGDDHPAARVEVTLRNGSIESVVVIAANVSRDLPPYFDEFRAYVGERSQNDLSVMFTDVGDGFIRPRTTPESLALWERYVEEYTADGGQ